MIFVTTYHPKPYMSRQDTKDLLARFAEKGPGPGTIAHYIAVDDSGGVVISDTDDLTGSFRNILEYAEWIEFDTKAMLTIDDAVPLMMDALP